MTDFVTIYEVGPRDGLQNEPRVISTEDKISLVNRLSDCGFRKIEVTSFVSPKWVAQMHDADTLMTAIKRHSAIDYAALTPNIRGFERALRAKADEVAIFASASEGFSQKNINCSVAESLERFKPVARSARAQNIALRGYLSCVVECPYDGAILPSQTAKIARDLHDMGCYEISLGDTIGKGQPKAVRAMLEAVTKVIPPENLAGHFHDTDGNALENIAVALEYGLRVFDASVGGLGGCPYAPGAKGNVASEAVVEFVENRGYFTGVNPEKLKETALFAQRLRRKT